MNSALDQCPFPDCTIPVMHGHGTDQTYSGNKR